MEVEHLWKLHAEALTFSLFVCRDDDYRRAMNELTGFSFTSKNLHNNAPDSMAMLADYLCNGIKSVSVAKRLF